MMEKGYEDSSNVYLMNDIKIYDEIVFIETERLSGNENIQSFLVDKMCKRKKCRSALSWGCLIVDYNIFIEFFSTFPCFSFSKRHCQKIDFLPNF